MFEGRIEHFVYVPWFILSVFFHITPPPGDLFGSIVTGGGYFCNLATGSLYFLATRLAYEQPMLASPSAD